MFDIDLSFSNIENLKKDIPVNLHKYVDNALIANSIDEVSKIGLDMIGGSSTSGLVTGLGVGSGKANMWDKVTEEVYKFICTNAKEYELERQKGSGAINSIVAVISTSLASQFSVSVGILTGIVTVAIIGVGKIGKNAWCELKKTST